MSPTLKAVTLAALAFGAIASPALAQSYMRQSCQDLWVARNQIYKDAGYCFKTSRAIRYFGNAGCQVDNQSDVRLSRSDRAAVDAIVRAEQAKGCSD
jgi:hypothetical protein